MGPIIRRLSSLGIAIGLTVLMASCGSGSKQTTSTTATTAFTSTYPSTPVPPTKVVARVGATSITGAIYDHWLAVISAQVKPSGIGAPAGKPFKLDPPNFTACIKLLKAGAPQFRKANLKPGCAKEYAKAEKSTLELLITGYWVREAAAEAKVSLPESTVERKFQEAIKAQFPAPGAFQKFQEETLQSDKDVMFGIRSKLLTTLLFAKFTKEQGKGRSEAAITSAYEAKIEKWKAKTVCQPGYVVKVCREYSEAKPSSS
jgi:hypothetical protein